MLPPIPTTSTRCGRDTSRDAPVTRLVCLDIDGTLTDGVRGPALPGAVEAVRRVRARHPVRLVTNTTSLPHRVLAEHLADLGLLDRPESLVTPVTVARGVLPARGHASGILLVEPGAREDYAWFREDADGPAVLLGTEGHTMTIADLQPAFRRLLQGGILYTLQRNRYFKKGGELMTDLGPIVAFLAYASGREGENLGKPSQILFDDVAAEAGVSRGEIVMVGDDAEFDVAASITLGMMGVLVRTGKYRPHDESRVAPAPTAALESIEELPRWLGIG